MSVMRISAICGWAVAAMHMANRVWADYLNEPMHPVDWLDYTSLALSVLCLYLAATAKEFAK